ncbi:cAMP-binding proteins - catabolite gene activator and regulatory subunit of cAMP-dependent protein kinases [Rubrivivax sp. A210]|uniref:Crp/Fnr family transcriptional regulator n=1 Tax=Rubrivivax sp. A210 TaxID=2772301 RepID=UPI0019195BD2|nr:Crp/Fnr family transcriptional regulator [Rubrivivax sp. A210]CAD5374295.1 cAMP-binding proteins - catabolite gene activator and regulatory subunit of cAMP-dependent protein kinases [Rubrivivax sp. A210]
MPPPRPTPDILSDQLLRAIAQRGGVRSYPAQAVLVTEEDRSDALFIVLSGRVKAYGSGDDGREVVYGTMGAGEYFGEMTLDGGPRSASVMTLEATTCAVVPGAEVREFLARHPDFALHLIQKLIRLARASTEHVKSLALEDVYGRIARLLRTLARPGEDGVAVLPDRLTQQDIAERVGSSREMVSRVFKTLAEGGYIEQRGGRIALLRALPPRW